MTNGILSLKKNQGVPLGAQWLPTQILPMSLWVWSLAPLSWLRIYCCHELFCRWQMLLGSHVVVAVVSALSYSSDSTPHLGTSVCCACSSKNTKKKKIRLDLISSEQNKSKLQRQGDSSLRDDECSDFELVWEIMKVLEVTFIIPETLARWVL